MRQIIDNFLPKEDFERLQDALLNFDTGFPWYMSHVVSYDMPVECSEFNNWQLSHSFYNLSHDSHKSPALSLVTPVLAKLDPKILIRAKANLNCRTEKIEVHAYHTDVPEDELADLCKTAVLYINDNDGYTIFEDDGEKVESIANRLLIFPAKQKHSGSTCTNQKFRCVINFNWI
jgi:hypothetical protein